MSSGLLLIQVRKLMTISALSPISTFGAGLSGAIAAARTSFAACRSGYRIRTSAKGQPRRIQHSESDRARRSRTQRDPRTRRDGSGLHTPSPVLALGRRFTARARARGFFPYIESLQIRSDHYMTSPLCGQATQMLEASLGGGRNGDFNALYQIGGARRKWR